MKKILSLALVGVMMFSALPMAYAAEPGGNWAAGTAVEYTADADANRSYTITVPAELQPGQSGTVTLKGMWASNETVNVTADASVELTNSINAADKHTLAITFPGIEKAGDNTVEKTYTESVAVAAMPADALFGTWSGKFNYNVEFDNGIVDFTIDGVAYQVKNGTTWEEWLASDAHTQGFVTAEAKMLPMYDVTIICNANKDSAIANYNGSGYNIPTPSEAIKGLSYALVSVEELTTITLK